MDRSTVIFRQIMIRAVMLSAALSAVFGRAAAYDAVALGRTVYIYNDCDCGSCHGVDAEGIRSHQTPTLAGREAWYLEMQLRVFRSGARGAHPKDETGCLSSNF
ncbi:MAG: cytochrome c553 [Lentimonas sp.]|jgi:cytochrome c553